MIKALAVFEHLLVGEPDLSFEDHHGLKILKILGLDYYLLIEPLVPSVLVPGAKPVFVKSAIDKLSDDLASRGMSWANLAVLGSREKDLEVMNKARYRFCTRDADPLIEAISDYVLKKKRGDGVLLEMSHVLHDILR